MKDNGPNGVLETIQGHSYSKGQLADHLTVSWGQIYFFLKLSANHYVNSRLKEGHLA